MGKLQMKRIFVMEDRCNGCRICELRCSFYHDQMYSPTLSRIYVVKNEIEGFTKPKTCVICGKCIESCPENAISKSELTGAISINEDQCTGCMECVKACPFEVMRFNHATNKAFTCDLCDGDPQCVKYCPEEALFYTTSKEFSDFKKKENEKKASDKIKKPHVIPQE